MWPMSGVINSTITQIFTTHKILPGATITFQFPTPLAHKGDINLTKSLIPRPSLLLGLQISFHFTKWYFLFPVTSPREGSDGFLQLLNISFVKDPQRHLVNNNIG
jgi:hypothetical protein